MALPCGKLIPERHLDPEVRDGRPGIGKSHSDRKDVGEEGAYLADRSCVVNVSGHIRNIPWDSQQICLDSALLDAGRKCCAYPCYASKMLLIVPLKTIRRGPGNLKALPQQKEPMV